MDENTVDMFIEALVRLLGLRDLESEEHTRRVAALTIDLARACGVPEKLRIHLWRGALLHDIGKIGISDPILLKNGKLTAEEFEIVSKHPLHAYELLRPIPHLHLALDIPYCHHEKWDGTGYPRGLKGKQIPLAARIFAIVDVWDALLSDRHYRPAWEPEDAERYMHEQAGRHFDPDLISIFLGNDSVIRLPFNLEMKFYNPQIS